MSVLVGPIGAIGHPFRHGGHELVVERQIGDHLVYAFDNAYLHQRNPLALDEPIEAVVVWDPVWLRAGVYEGTVNEMYRVWQLAQNLDVPLISVVSDWFSGWRSNNRIGANFVDYSDAIICDRAGAAALRTFPPLKVTDPDDRRYVPIVELPNLLSYGRLPVRGGDEDLVRRTPHEHPQRERTIDVCVVGNRHASNVILRSFYMEQLDRLCQIDGFTLYETSNATAEEMEQLYLDSKVVFNASVGCMLNCRVHEALACGAALLTDAWNIANYTLEGSATIYANEGDLKWKLRSLLWDAERRQERAERGAAWAADHSPEKLWDGLLTQAKRVATRTGDARKARQRFTEEVKA